MRFLYMQCIYFSYFNGQLAGNAFVHAQASRGCLWCDRADCQTIIITSPPSATEQIDSNRKRVKTIELCKRKRGGHWLQSIPLLINSVRGRKSAARHRFDTHLAEVLGRGVRSRPPSLVSSPDILPWTYFPRTYPPDISPSRTVPLPFYTV